jgi:hypothetical protein
VASQPNQDRSSLVLAEEGALLIERSAFDHIERGARLVILGITPGAQQRELADAAFSNALSKCQSAAAASRSAKFAASFGGAMRANLVRMLDEVGAASLLGLRSLADAFDPATQGEVHFTSALRYPVFHDGANYNGQVSMLSSPTLRSMIETLLAEEVKQLPGAIWQPLGDKPVAALEHLVSLGILEAKQIAPALPHPSGANAERVSFFLGNKGERDLSPKTNAAKIKAQRNAIKAFYASRTGVPA